MSPDEVKFWRQFIELVTAPLIARIEKLEAERYWMIETDWAAIGRQQHRDDDRTPPQTRPMSSQDRGTQ